MRRVILAMAKSGQKITFAEVERRTGVSHTFLYNPRVREMIDEARRDPNHVQDSHNGVPPTPAAMLRRLHGIGVEASRICSEQQACSTRIAELTVRLFELIDETQAMVTALTKSVRSKDL